MTSTEVEGRPPPRDEVSTGMVRLAERPAARASCRAWPAVVLSKHFARTKCL